MAVLNRSRNPNPIMRLGMLTGNLKPDELDPDNEAYISIEETMKAHRTIRPPTQKKPS